MVKLLAPDPDASATIRGVTYKPDGDGYIDVPPEEVEEFAPHGFFLPPTPLLHAKREPRPLPKEPTLDVDTMKREQMMDFAREAGVKAAVPISNNQLRAICCAIRDGKDVVGMPGVAGVKG